MPLFDQYQRVNGTDNSNANVTLVPAVANSVIKVMRLELATKTADDLTLKAGASPLDVWYMGATSNGFKDYTNLPLVLPVNTALVVSKGTAATALSYVVSYLVVPN